MAIDGTDTKMEKNKTVRTIAYDVLYEVEKNRAYANIALDKALLHSQLNDADCRLATEIVYGCVKMKLHLDTIIKAYCKKNKIDLRTLIILRMALYQLIYLERVPEHAILDESVKLSKFLELNTDKFINAVLRSYLRNEEVIVWPNKRKARNQYISKWYSFPQWMVDMWVKAYGFQDTEKLCEYFNASATTWIRVNTLKATPEEVLEKLKELNIYAKQHTYLKQAIQISSFQNVRDSSLFKEGKIIVQDLSSMLPAYILSPQSNHRILDMCAAPGGKTTQISAIMKNTGEVVACDIHTHRVKLIEENLTRLNVSNVNCIVSDARNLSEKYNEYFDSILLDAPCSGLGVLNRRADLRWNKRRADIDSLVSLQESLLDEATKYLKPGGILIYSTCTLNKKENEEQLNVFLEKHSDFELVPFELFGQECLEGYKTIYPFLDESDGFFVSKLQRKE